MGPEHFCTLLALNMDNENLSDEAFRDLIRTSIVDVEIKNDRWRELINRKLDKQSKG